MRNNTVINITITKQGNKVIVEATSSLRRVWQRKQGIPKQTFDTESAKKYLTAQGLTGYTILEESATVGNSEENAQSGKWTFEKILKKTKAKSPRKTTSRTQN